MENKIVTLLAILAFGLFAYQTVSADKYERASNEPTAWYHPNCTDHFTNGVWIPSSCADADGNFIAAADEDACGDNTWTASKCEAPEEE